MERARRHRHRALSNVRRANRGRARPLPRLPVRVPAGRASGSRPARARDRLARRLPRRVRAPRWRSPGRSACSSSPPASRRLRHERRRPPARAAVVALVPLLLGGVILTRFDLVPAALVAGAMLLLVIGRLRAGALVVGSGSRRSSIRPSSSRSSAIAAWRRCGGRRELATVLGARRCARGRRLPSVPAPRAGRGARLARPAARPPAADREPRRGRPARAPPRRRDVARVGVGQRLAEPHRRRRGHAGRAPGNRAGRRGRARLGLLRTRPCEPGAARQARGGSGRRLRRAEQGSLAAVPRLARAPRPARRRSARSPAALADDGRVRAYRRLVPGPLLGAREGVRPARVVARACPRGRSLALLAVLMWPAREPAPARSRSPAPSPGRT